MAKSTHFLNALLLVGLGAIFLFYSHLPQPISHEGNAIYADKEILQAIEINATGHVYPYTATVVSMSCLLAVIMVIICLGSNL